MENNQSYLEKLSTDGALIMTAKDGKKLFLVLSRNLGRDAPNGLLITIEKGGAFFWDFQRDINQFMLYAYGFNAFTAPLVLEVVKQLKSELVAAKADVPPALLMDQRDPE